MIRSASACLKSLYSLGTNCSCVIGLVYAWVAWLQPSLEILILLYSFLGPVKLNIVG